MALLSFFWFIDQGKQNVHYKSENSLLIYLAFLCLIILRTYVDIDSLPDLSYYKSLFDNNDFLDNLSASFNNDYAGTEKGFILLSFLCHLLSSTFVFELLVISVIMITLYFRMIKRYSPYFWLGVLIYFITIYPMSTYILRQYLAMALLFGTIPLVVERKIIPYVLVIVIAYFIHRSSLVWAPVFFIYGIRDKKYLIILLVIFAASLYVINDVFSQVLFYMGDDFERYQNYLEGDNITTSYWGALTNTLILIVYMIVYKGNIFADGLNRLLLICISISVVLSWISINRVGLMFRLNTYFVQYIILLVPLIVARVKNNTYRWIPGAVFLFLYFLLNFMGGRNFHKHKMLFPESSLLLLLTIIISVIIFLLFIYTRKNTKNINYYKSKGVCN